MNKIFLDEWHRLLGGAREDGSAADDLDDTDRVISHDDVELENVSGHEREIILKEKRSLIKKI